MRELMAVMPAMPRRTLILLTAAALFLCYAATLRGMAEQWLNDEDMGHGFAVPVAVAWIVYRERNRWMPVNADASNWGWAVLVAGAAMHFVSVVGAGLFAGSLALLMSAAGAVVCFGGLALLKALRFPLLVSLCMLPKLAVVYNQATLPMQLLASRIAEAMMLTAGAAVRRSGNILDVGGHQISVAEACNGVRYMLPLIFLALVFGYLESSRPWLRLALVMAAIPLAIFANALRVAGSAWSPVLAEETPHAMFGWGIFVPCLGALAALGKLPGGSVRHAD